MGGKRINALTSSGVKINECTSRKGLRLEPGAPKVFIVAPSRPSSASALRSAPRADERAALDRDNAAIRTAPARVFT